MLEAKATGASALQKKKDLQNAVFFWQSLNNKTKKSSEMFREVSSVFQQNFDVSKTGAVLGRGQGNF